MQLDNLKLKLLLKVVYEENVPVALVYYDSPEVIEDQLKI